VVGPPFYGRVVLEEARAEMRLRCPFSCSDHGRVKVHECVLAIAGLFAIPP
jgi:hypothetical protein